MYTKLEIAQTIKHCADMEALLKVTKIYKYLHDHWGYGCWSTVQVLVRIKEDELKKNNTHE